MKILHVIQTLRNAAGTSVFCGELSNELAKLGHQVVIALDNSQGIDMYPVDSAVKIISMNDLGSENFDVMHIHGLWTPLLHKASCWAHKNEIPVVWSPHGMLQKWALKHKWWKKFAALLFYQWNDLSKANCIHATATSEVEDVRRLRLRNRVLVVPLGVRINGDDCAIQQKSCCKNTLLFVSRIQKKKGLPVLIYAWQRLPKEVKAKWRVRIVGPDEDNHTAELKELCVRLGVASDFTFVGPKYGQDLDAEYRTSDLFVLPTHSENFGSVVIEALARGVPVICSKGAPWQELEVYKCGWWPADSVSELSDALMEALKMSEDERKVMGLRGKELVIKKYSWQAVCESMISGYKGVVNES